VDIANNEANGKAFILQQQQGKNLGKIYSFHVEQMNKYCMIQELVRLPIHFRLL